LLAFKVKYFLERTCSHIEFSNRLSHVNCPFRKTEVSGIDLAVVDVEAGNDAAAEHEERAGAVLWLPLRVRERGALGLMRGGAGCSSRAVP